MTDTNSSARLSRRAFLGGAAAGGLTLAAGRLPAVAAAAAPSSARALRPDLAADVRREFLGTYRSYLRIAGDHDEMHPVSRTASDFFAQGHPVRLTTIESLDTLYLMEADEEVAEGVRFVVGELSFDIDARFQVFETIIRVVGGLLSGFHATHDRACSPRRATSPIGCCPPSPSRRRGCPTASSTSTAGTSAATSTCSPRSAPASRSSATSAG